MKAESSSPSVYLTDGGMETTLVFHEGQDLPEFAAFHLQNEETGRKLIQDYYRNYLNIAEEFGTGFILESTSWRANPDWGKKIGYDESELRRMNKLSISEIQSLKKEYSSRISDIMISGCIGPRGDGYKPSNQMTPAEAEAYHSPQVRTLAECGVDLITAMTFNYAEEAIGVANAAKETGVKSVISFTLETDGCLATGESLQNAIQRTDAASGDSIAYFMINCAHPTHFENVLASGGDWIQRIHGIRANASRLSHEELDECETLDSGDPLDLANRIKRLSESLPDLNVFGGCCGTDVRHVQSIGKALS